MEPAKSDAARTVQGYFAHWIELARKLTSWVASGFRSHHASLRGANDLDALRDRLDIAKGRVAKHERLVAGWREVIESQHTAGRDLEAARDLRQTFENGLEVAISDKGEAE